jgi:hypothetical protein
MPDPRLVSRAQRAATMLERAWEQWRTVQGLEAEPLPPVSSYVGYSIEEPWGRPRVVFGVDAEDAERLAALLQTSIGFAAEGPPRSTDPGYGAPGRPGFAADRPAGPDRGYDQSLFDDVRGRIPVQGWPPEFSESREQLNGAGPVQAGPVHPGEPELPLDLGPATGERLRDAAGPGWPDDLKPPSELGLSDEFQSPDDFAAPDEPGLFAADGPYGVDAPYGVPYAGGAPYGVPGGLGVEEGHGAEDAEDRYDVTGPYRAVGAPRDTPGDEAGDTASADGRAADVSDGGAQAGDTRAEHGRDGDLRAGDTRAGDTPDQDVRDDGMRAGDVQDEEVRAGDVPDGDATAGEVPDGDATAGDVPDGEELATDARGGLLGKHPVGGDEFTGEDIQDAQRPGTPGEGGGPVPGPRHGSAAAGPEWPPSAPGDSPSAPDDSPSAPGDSPSVLGDSSASAPGDSSPSSPGQEPPAATDSADEAHGGPAAASDSPTDPASRGSITDTMAAELAGWAAGELPGQAAARLASWATAGGAVARSRQQARLGSGGTATERVS